MIVRDRSLVYRCIHLSTVISLHLILQVISLFQCLISVVDGFACDIAQLIHGCSRKGFASDVSLR